MKKCSTVTPACGSRMVPLTGLAQSLNEDLHHLLDEITVVFPEARWYDQRLDPLSLADDHPALHSPERLHVEEAVAKQLCYYYSTA